MRKSVSQSKLGHKCLMRHSEDPCGKIDEQSGSFLNAPTAHPEERSDEGSQK